MSLLLFKKQFLELIRSGEKQTTIRRWRNARVRAGRQAFAPGLGWIAIEEIHHVKLRDLNDADARADGFNSAASMRRELRKLYPQSRSDGKSWFRIRFKLPPNVDPRGHVTRQTQLARPAHTPRSPSCPGKSARHPDRSRFLPPEDPLRSDTPPHEPPSNAHRPSEQSPG
jgi:hypothetical protein